MVENFSHVGLVSGNVESDSLRFKTDLGNIGANTSVVVIDKNSCVEGTILY